VRAPAIAAAVLIVALSLVGCTREPVIDSSLTEDTDKSWASEEPSEEPEPVEDLTDPFDTPVEYEDGVTMSVSTPVVYEPPASAYGHDQTVAVIIEFTIGNGSDVLLDPLADAEITSGGVSADLIIDLETPGLEAVAPGGAILPGKSMTWKQAFSIADVDDVVVQISPHLYDYEELFFTAAQ
jgi:hypothetical protein